jgi:hypothetical protein
MSIRKHFHKTNGFSRFQSPENIFEEIPLVPTHKRPYMNSKGFKIAHSQDRFWQQRRTFESQPFENLNSNLLHKHKTTRQFGEMLNETDIKDDLKNIDRWVFDNLKKIRFFAEESRIKRNTTTIKNMINPEKDRYLPNLDLKFLDIILREEKAGLHKADSQDLNSTAENIQKSAAIMQKVAVTAETINSEHNKMILLELVKKKIRSYEKFNERDEGFIQMVSKMILMDLISSFTVLKIFKHHNIFHIKNLLTETKKDLHLSVGITMDDHSINSKTQKDLNFKAFEKALFDNFTLCNKEIKNTKRQLNGLRDSINRKMQKLNQKVQEIAKFSYEVERRENPTDYKRKVGVNINAQEFIDIAELKAQLIDLENSYEKYSKKTKLTIVSHQEESKKIEKAIEDLKFKKTLFYMKLKEIYYDFLTFEDNLVFRNKTIVSIVKLLWSIKAEVKEECFSKFFEPEHIVFLFKYTKLHNEFLELRRQSNNEKKVIKEQLIGVYHNIVEEKESAKIEEVKRTIFSFKTANLRVLQKMKIKDNKSAMPQWELVEPNNDTIIRDSQFINISSNFSKRNAVNIGGQNTQLTSVSESLCQLKENFIKAAVDRVSVNGKVHFMGTNSVWLKKLFTIFFGKKEAQFLINELIKMKNIKIREIII